LKFWDVETGLELLSLEAHAGWVSSVALAGGGRVVSAGADEVKVWDADRRQSVLILDGRKGMVEGVAFAPDGKKLFAWGQRRAALAWSMKDGLPADPANAPAHPGKGPAVSRDGFLRAEAQHSGVVVTDSRLADPKANHWPLPDAAERKRYHGEQAALAEKQKRHFAAAFHLGRLLLDSPEADLKKRRDAALKGHAAQRQAKGK
jgi:hypothetical protein